MNLSRQLAAVVLLAAMAAGCKKDGTITVHSLAFKGVQHVDVARLKAALATKENAKVPVVGWEFPWSRKNFFDRGRFDADLKRIEAFYADRGFPDARVTDFDVKLNDKQDAVDVTVTIDEGQAVRIAGVTFRDFGVIPDQRLDQLRKSIPLHEGEPRDRQQVIAAHELAVNELRDHGYPYARVATDETVAAAPAGGNAPATPPSAGTAAAPGGAAAGGSSPAPGTPVRAGSEVTIVFTAEPGPVAHFGPIEIAGNTSVGDRVIERQLTYKPGELYRRSVVQDSQRRLYAMDLFQFVNIESLNPEKQEPQVNTRVTVAEGKHQRVNFGVGYGTEEKARVDAEYRHVNFLGGARTAGIHGRWSSLDRGLRLDFTQPYLFTPHFSLGGQLQRWYTYTPAYSSVVTGGKTTLTHRESARFSWAVSLSSERNSSAIDPSVLSNPQLYSELIATAVALGLDPRTGRQEGTLSALGFDLQRSTADNLLNARRGYQLAFHLEQAGRYLPGTFAYESVSADARHYLPVSDRLVIANRIQIGDIHPAGSDQSLVPFSRKFFLGGATSIRGWGRYEVSPASDGLPIGGNSMLAFTSEARLSFGGSLGAVVFVDGGNVWAGDWGYRLGDLRYAVGPGLRYQTPVGPIRLDVGYQLNPIEGLLVNGQPQARRWRIHFSIGQAF